MSRRLRGSTSQRRYIFIGDSSSTTGAGLANLVHNSSGLVAYYIAGDLNNEVQITLVTATLGTYTSGGFIAVDNTTMPGWYEIGIPDAALDAGDQVAIQFRGAANMIPVNLYIDLDAVDYQTDAFGALKPTTAGRTLDVSSGGEAGIDLANIGSPTTTVNLSGLTIKNATDNASQASVNLIPTNPLLTTDSRLNNLDFAISTVNNNILNLNNLSAKMNLFGSPLLEIPESGSTVYAFTLVVKDDEDKLVALDASPTITAANAAGTNRSGNLSAVSNPSTGRYTFTYTVANTHASESLRIAVSGTVSAEARYVEWIGAVVNYDSLTVLQSVQTTVSAIDTRLPAAPAAVGDIPTANQNRDAVMNAMPNGGWVDGSFGDRWLIGSNNNREVQVTGSNHVSADVHAFQTAVLNAAAIAAGALNGKGDWLTTLGANAPTNWINAAAIATDAIDSDAIADSAVNEITVNLFKYGDIQLWTSPANQIQVTITKV